MIIALIFHLHIVAALYAFTKRWQETNAREGFLAVAMIALVFLICWSLTGTIGRLVYPVEWDSAWFDADAFSLVLLLVPEIIFFRAFFLRDRVSPQESGEPSAS